MFKVKCLDSFTSQQTRLVVIVDGLDSCEQDKVLLVLDAVHMLFSDTTSPFIVILAIDPHVISKVSEFIVRPLNNYITSRCILVIYFSPIDSSGRYF
jgi:ankyrin repeat-rich membrane spanning protein